MKSKGFKKKGSYYYLESPEVYVIINLQKSNYDNKEYYIGYGYFFKEIVADEPLNLSSQHWHSQSRFCISIDGKENQPVNIENIDKNKFINSLEKEIEHELIPYLTAESFKKRLDEEQELSYTLYIEAKQFFGLVRQIIYL